MSFKTPDDKTLQALFRLQRDADWQTVEQWLSGVLAEQDVLNRTLIGERLHQGQGGAQVLAFVLEQAQTAGDVLSKRNRPRPAANVI